MPESMTFDEFNALYAETHDDRSMPYEQYFGEMRITEEQKEKREKTARELEEIMLLALMIAYYMNQTGYFDYADIAGRAVSSYKEVIRSGSIEVSEFFIEQHIPYTVANIFSTMARNPDNEWNYTIDRARAIAENEANSLWNDAEFTEAVLKGKKHKRWRAIIDKATRDSHREANGQVKPIMEPFEINGYLAQFPRDDSLGMDESEIANCRCSVQYY